MSILREISLHCLGSEHQTRSFTFPGGEIQVQVPDLPAKFEGDLVVTARLETAESLIQLCLLTEILDRVHDGRRSLVVPYFPYARQDRVMAAHEAFSLKAIARIINSLGFDRVVTCDPHSDVTPALVENIRVIPQVELAASHEQLRPMLGSGRVTVIAPDAGAAKKSFDLARRFCLPLLTASKVRDTATGAILRTELHAPATLANGDVLIVDDICDGGRTFIELAKVLREAGARRVYLYVTHGIFSQGLGVFSGLIDEVFTTDSFLSNAVAAPHLSPRLVPRLNASILKGLPMKLNPLHCIDFYKADHRRQYPEGTTLVNSNFTPRSDKLSTIPASIFDGTVTFFGLQFFIKDFLIDSWNSEFFDKPKAEVVAKYKRRMDTSLGVGAIPADHIEALHDLGFLPICIKALPEGSRVHTKVPVLVIFNTHPGFFWLTNYLESVLSSYLWKPMTSATVARHYRLLLDRYAAETGADARFVQFQAHDFSFRGMSGPEDAAISGAAHLCSFVGTDTVSAIDLIENYYNGDAEKELIGCSVPATEHSVMCMGTMEDEIGTFRRLITKLYPAGIVSIVSDTWDFWQVITEFTVTLKAEILTREGKVVFRPDSGDPVKIICGDPEALVGSPAFKGAVECLWDIFGGTTTEKGFKVLDSHVGLIYGDSITLTRAEAILAQLKAKGFASSNVVFGVGSFTYQYATRDTFGFAVKSTYGEVNGFGREIFKAPKTDDGIKKSARGLIKVTNIDGVYCLVDRQASIDEPDDCLREVFRDGRLLVDENIAAIRGRLAGKAA